MPNNLAIAIGSLKRKTARVKMLRHFTLELNYQVENYIQPLILGFDARYLNIGLSVISTKKELFSAEVKLLENISYRCQYRLMYRRIIIQILLYRKPQFKNRKRMVSSFSFL